MSNTNISSSFLATIEIVTIQMTYYGPIILLTVGIFGCLCNFLTFTSRQLRENSCAFYFLCSAIFEFLSITFGLSTRLAADHFDYDLQNSNRIFCKFRAYYVSSIPLIATYFILLSAIDRYMSSSTDVYLRSFSKIKVAYRNVIIFIIIGLISCSHILILYDLRPKCATSTGIYAIFDSIFVVLWLGVIPHVLMLTFGFLTLTNIRRTRQRRIVKSQMMLVQIGLSSILSLTRMIYYTYYIHGPLFTGDHKVIGSFLMSLTTLLYYTNYVKSFYIYTLTSQLFRSIFIQRIHSCIQKRFESNTSIIMIV
ncbi:unnamed protein product [Rotaria sp. Silwood1]|nr:unnamed protein product [Rotaria sp. Silwood1]CAF3551138.1 unnamed protein product [Rotaria sp. Silwood1]CAF3599766.1 unnamed protein product [Rotaria sp. Silwood1]CAF4665498.1 unnamed protein product [Rotaria sp. Silwood1]CAF4795883.1 unnamed protein product [Rotaria sp. Silwood1]